MTVDINKPMRRKCNKSPVMYVGYVGGLYPHVIATGGDASGTYFSADTYNEDMIMSKFENIPQEPQRTTVWVLWRNRGLQPLLCESLERAESLMVDDEHVQRVEITEELA